MNPPTKMVLRLSTAIALAAMLGLFAVSSGFSADSGGLRVVDRAVPNRLVDDYFRDTTRSPSSIVDPAVRNRLVDDSFRDSTIGSGSIVDPAVRNRLVDDSFRDPTAVGAVPSGYSAQEWNALQLRSEALDKKYHLGAYRTANIGGDSAQAERALMLRSDALNRKYHLGRYAIVRPTQQASGFDWGDAGIGAGALLGLVLLASGGTLVVRRRRTLAHA